ncbi:uncharacterized protein PG998_003051 [Apiospora kogelbergensis]|uniref:uncharacterized protein n=1 Tax=Apiospora kogelbergensis TaxID=1337665 RepID=UPI003131E630
MEHQPTDSESDGMSDGVQETPGYSFQAQMKATKKEFKKAIEAQLVTMEDLDALKSSLAKSKDDQAKQEAAIKKMEEKLARAKDKLTNHIRNIDTAKKAIAETEAKVKTQSRGIKLIGQKIVDIRWHLQNNAQVTGLKRVWHHLDGLYKGIPHPRSIAARLSGRRRHIPSYNTTNPQLNVCNSISGRVLRKLDTLRQLSDQQ